MQHTNASKTSRLPSLIETISQGFAAVNRRLWVLAIPLLLDIFYWVGPRISPQPLLDQLVAIGKALDPQAWDVQRQQMVQQLGSTNMPVDLAPFVVPKFIGGSKFINILAPLITTPAPPIAPTIWHIGSFATLIGAFIVINTVGLLATSIYLLPLAEAVRGGDATGTSWRQWLRVFASFAGILLLIIGMALLVIVPLSLVASIATLLSPAIGQIIFIFGLALLFWLLFTASFSFDAVVISGVGPFRALLTSLFIVQRSFWGAIGLFVLGWLILSGMSIIWQLVAATTIGLVVAMLGSAYISSGLAAAHLIFYRDRLSRIARRS